MKALLLAAGFGTRLKPLTNNTPKALVKVGSLTLLERAVNFLKNNGVKKVAVNSHYLAINLEDFIKNKKDWGLPIKIFFEEQILETGGAIKNAKSFLKDSEPFVVLSVDILTDIDLNLALEFYKKSHVLATLLVNNRASSRPFLVDKNNYLVGHLDKIKNIKRLVATNYAEPLREVGFLGLHIISPKIFSLMPEEKCFSAVDLYLNLVAKGQSIKVLEFNNNYWLDVGTKEHLTQAEIDFKKSLI